MTESFLIEPVRLSDPHDVVDALQNRYEMAVATLRQALQTFLETGTAPDPALREQFCYPGLTLTYRPEGAIPSNRRAFAKFSGPGVFGTTVTQPHLFRAYLLEQLRPLMGDYGAVAHVGRSRQEIPYPYIYPAVGALGYCGS
jgi:AMP nucleosidase